MDSCGDGSVEEQNKQQDIRATLQHLYLDVKYIKEEI